MHTGNITTGLVLTDAGIFGPNVTATVTNWLATCILACTGGDLFSQRCGTLQATCNTLVLPPAG